MQRVPDALASRANLPAGWVPLSAVEQTVRKLLVRDFTRIPNTPRHEFSGQQPVSFWDGEAASLRSQEIWERPDREQIASGIVSHLMERLICPDYGEANAHEPSCFFADDRVMTHLNIADALYVCDPATAPMHCNTKIEASQFVEFSSNRRTGHPFIDRYRWTILISPRFDLARCEAEREELGQVWERLSQFSGARLGFRQASGRTNRKWKAASEIARLVEADIQRISNNSLPRRGTPQFNELVQDIRIYLAIFHPDQRSRFGYRMVADYLGVDADLRHNTAIRSIMAALNLKDQKA